MTTQRDSSARLDRANHTHYWLYPHAIIQGKRPGWNATVRYCRECDARQVCHIAPDYWVKATGDYARDEHYKDKEGAQ